MSTECKFAADSKYALKRIGKITWNLTNSQCHHHHEKENWNKPCNFVFNPNQDCEEEIVHFKDDNVYVNNFKFHCQNRDSKSWWILNPRQIHVGEGDYIHVENESIYKVASSYVSAELVSFIASTSLENENKTIGLLFHIHFIYISYSFHIHFIKHIKGTLRRVYKTLFKDNYRNKLIKNGLTIFEHRLNEIVEKDILSYKKFNALWWYILHNNWDLVNS